MRERGFSLIELLAVLALIALSIALVAPAIGRQMPQLALRAEARRVAMILETAQTQALAEHRPIAVTIDLAGDWVAREGARPFFIDKGISLAVTAAQAAATAQGQPRFLFFPDGSTTGGRIELMRAGQTFFVDADWLTGHVRTYRPDSKNAI